MGKGGENKANVAFERVGGGGSKAKKKETEREREQTVCQGKRVAA